MSWAAEVRATVAAIQSVLAEAERGERDDLALRDAFEAIALRHRNAFASLTWLWGPPLSRRNPIVFRPFILTRMGTGSTSETGHVFNAWEGPTAPALDAWFAAVDAADDVELTRELYRWRLYERTAWKKRADTWRRDLRARFDRASTTAARQVELAKLKGLGPLDAKTARDLYQRDPAAARAFIRESLPYLGRGTDRQQRASWERFLARVEGDADEDFYFALYRQVADASRWHRDALRLAEEIRDPTELDRALSRRTPSSISHAPTLLALVRARGRDVVPYVMRHAAAARSWGARDSQEVTALVALANENGWTDLWAAFVRHAAGPALVDAEVARLLAARAIPDHVVRARLLQIASAGGGAVAAWFREPTALALYERFPELARGALSLARALTWQRSLGRIVDRAIELGDDQLLDAFAGRILAQTWGTAAGWPALLAKLARYYESLAEAEFVARAAAVLTQIRAGGISYYAGVLRDNPLGRLFFLRSTTLYLSDGAAVRDLLEAPEIHVQVLGLRALASADPRAVELAAANVDLLQALLFRRLRRKTRHVAYVALENAGRRDLETARALVSRMRDALTLTVLRPSLGQSGKEPPTEHPREELVGLLGRTLARWPELRTPAEIPRVFAEACA